MGENVVPACHGVGDEGWFCLRFTSPHNPVSGFTHQFNRNGMYPSIVGESVKKAHTHRQLTQRNSTEAKIQNLPLNSVNSIKKHV